MITKLTKEQERLMAKVRDEWIKTALLAGDEIDEKAARSGIDWMYKLAGLKKPVTIIVDSPLAVQYAIPIARELLKGAGHSQVRSQVHSQIGSQVGSQVRSQVYSQIGSQVRSQIGSQVHSQIGSQIGSQVDSQVDSQVRSQVHSQIGSQVGSQVRSQVYSQIGSQVRSQIGSQVYSQVHSQIDSQVRSQIRSQVYSQVGSQVRSQVRSQIRSQVYSQVHSQIDSQVRSQIRSQVYSQIGSQVHSFEQFAFNTISYYAGWVAYIDFFERIGVVKHTEWKKYTKFLKSGVFMGVYLDGLAIVCRRPKFIARDQNNALHFDHGAAIEWRDGYKLHYLHGVYFEKKDFKKIIDQKMTLRDISAGNLSADQNSVAIQMLRPDRLLKQVNAKLVHTGIKGTLLYEVKKFMGTDRTEYCMLMDHPTVKGKQYLEWVDPETGAKKDADLAQCAAWRDADGNPIPLEDYLLAVAA